MCADQRVLAPEPALKDADDSALLIDERRAARAFGAQHPHGEERDLNERSCGR